MHLYVGLNMCVCLLICLNKLTEKILSRTVDTLGTINKKNKIGFKGAYYRNLADYHHLKLGELFRLCFVS